MRRRVFTGLALAAALAVGQPAIAPPACAKEVKPLRVVYDTIVTGLAYTESVAYDPHAKVLYASQFGSVLQPALKGGKGKIAKLSLDGKILEDQFLPAHGEIMNKPKGIWVRGGRLWVTDIDGVWEFDLKTRKSRKLMLPGAQFANDPTVQGNALYVSDNRTDKLFRVAPADFLNMKGEPKVTVVFSGKSINPNGLYPGPNGSLLMVGFASPKEPRGIYQMSREGKLRELTGNIGMLDGLYRMRDGSLIATDWVSGTVFHWSPKGGQQTIASGFKGPADLCVVPEKDGLLLVQPDLAANQLRFIKLAQ